MNYKHGMALTPTHNVWLNINQRCNNPKNKAYNNYGGRGIKICERWKDFENFLKDMGKKPDKMSIDRINNDGHYEPNNCRWATRIEQNRNTRFSIKINFNGQLKSLHDLAEIHGLNPIIVLNRYKRKWPIEELFISRLDANSHRSRC